MSLFTKQIQSHIFKKKKLMVTAGEGVVGINWEIGIDIYTTMCTEKAMAPYSSTLAWKIPWTEEPDRLQSMGSLRVRHD